MLPSGPGPCRSPRSSYSPQPQHWLELGPLSTATRGQAGRGGKQHLERVCSRPGPAGRALKHNELVRAPRRAEEATEGAGSPFCPMP